MKIKLIGIILLSFLITSCGDQSNNRTNNKNHNKTQKTIITITPKQSETDLYFSGTIEPKLLHNISSPVDGTVEKVSFQFGDDKKQGQVLFTVVSPSLAKNYQTALAAYLKAKDAYNIAALKHDGNKELWKLKLLSRDDYESDKSSYATATLAYIQARNTLVATLKKRDVSDAEIKTITEFNLQDTNKVRGLLAKKVSALPINAPITGVVLSPKSSSQKSDLTIGSQVKAGTTVLSMGDLTGVSVKIKIDETHINQIKPGMKISITGSAFPGIVLNGKISAVDLQADTSGGGLPTFPVTVIVPTLNPNQLKSIHVGMSAKVKIPIIKKNVISIPIKAIKQINGKNTVEVLVNSKTKSIPITTGQTSQSNVVVLSGLKSGDKVVYYH